MGRLVGWFLIGLCIWLQGCAAAVVGGAAAGGYYVGRDGRSAEQASADASITSAINTRYVQDDGIDALAIRVETRRGVVTLRGRVSSAPVAARAVELARAVPGVARVESQLIVAP